jgi:hypothetical protein
MLPKVRRASSSDSALVARSQPGLLVVVDSSTTLRRLPSVLVVNLGSNRARFTDDSGRAVLDQPAVGENRVRVRRLGYVGWEGAVQLRAGYRDTMEVGLSATGFCISAAKGSATMSVSSEPRGGLAVRVWSGWSKGPVTDARVWLETDKIRFPAQTGDSGWYLLPSIPAGHYRLRIMRIGYNAHAESVTVRPNVTDSLERTLIAVTCDLNCDGDVNVVHGMRNALTPGFLMRRVSRGS